MEEAIPSSTFSSKSLRRHHAAAAVTLLVTGALLVGDHLTWRSHERAFDTAREAIVRTGVGGEPLPPGDFMLQTARRMLGEHGDQGVVFVGNSIVQTAIVPPVIEKTLGLRSDARVALVTLSGTPTATLLRALVESGRRPPLVVVAIGPRTMLPSQPDIVRSLLSSSDSVSPAATRQGIFVARVNGALGDLIEERAPSLLSSQEPLDYARAVWDGLRFGFTAYRSSRVGNYAWVDFTDGSRRVALLNRTAGYERFRAAMIESSMARIRSGGANADRVLDELVALAEALATDGSTVVLVNMAIAPPLRRLEQEIHEERYRRVRERCARNPRLDFVDLGGDPVLARLPFVDGHHSLFDAAIQGSARIGELLGERVPRSLR